MAKIKQKIRVSTGLKAFKVEGVPELMKTVREIAKTMSGEGAAAFISRVQQLCLRPAIDIRDLAQELAPVGDSGRLRGSIYAAIIEGHVGAEFGTRKCFYAPFLEYGTSKMQRKSYLRPAMKALRTQTAAMMAEDLTKLIADVAEANAAHPPR